MTAEANAAPDGDRPRSLAASGGNIDAARLVEWFVPFDRVIVAFSGGVDSSVVLAAALRGCDGDVLAVTAHSPSVAQWQLELARRVAGDLGAEHEIVRTDEVDSPDYSANDARRCFHCKTTLYQTIDRCCRRAAANSGAANGAAANGDAVVVSGTNQDDLGDYRPGIEAGRRSGVRTPLADLGLGKTAVRQIAEIFGLENADLPASPCLSSRIAYGVRVTVERLQRIERAEDCLRAMGLADLRVRLHEGELARIEVPVDRIEWLACENRRGVLTEQLLSLGFRYVTLDLQGLRSGSMNRQLVPIGRPGSHRSPAPSVTDAKAQETP